MMRQHNSTRCLATLPVAASVAAAVFWGTLAVQKQINWLQLLIMNLSVFAGSSQFVMVEMYAAAAGQKMTLAVLVINRLSAA